MATVLDSNKTKIAKRVIEVFEYFDESHRTATVMDIVRRYGRPQSSTSELLSSLVELGLLYKDPRLRSYWPTPRLAVMGANAQPGAVRDGRLFAFMDDLARSTRHSVALFGMVGTHVQIFHWAPAPSLRGATLHRGSSEQLSASVAGHLLLSTMEPEQVTRLLRRLNAEAPVEARFNAVDLADEISGYRRQGHATGAAGFVAGALVTATLLPGGDEERPLALGFLYPDGQGLDPQALVRTLQRGIDACEAGEEEMQARPLMVAV